MTADGRAPEGLSPTLLSMGTPGWSTNTHSPSRRSGSERRGLASTAVFRSAPSWRSASANSAATALSSSACAAWNPEPDGVQPVDFRDPIDPFIPPLRQPLPALPRTSGNRALRESGRSTGRRRRAASAPASCTRCRGRRPDASGRRRRETASRRPRRCARSTWKMTSPRSRFKRPFSSRAKSSIPLERLPENLTTRGRAPRCFDRYRKRYSFEGSCRGGGLRRHWERVNLV